MPGRKPTRIKQLQGTLRRDRVNAREPRPPLGFPPARRGMPKLVRTLYVRLGELLEGLGVLTRVDGAALELAACALAEHQQAMQTVLERGATYKAKTGAGVTLQRPRPEVAIAADAWRRASAMLQQFGLTPAARSKVEGDQVHWPRLPGRRRPEAAEPIAAAAARDRGDQVVLGLVAAHGLDPITLLEQRQAQRRAGTEGR